MPEERRKSAARLSGPALTVSDRGGRMEWSVSAWMDRAAIWDDAVADTADRLSNSAVNDVSAESAASSDRFFSLAAVWAGVPRRHARTESVRRFILPWFQFMSVRAAVAPMESARGAIHPVETMESDPFITESVSPSARRLRWRICALRSQEERAGASPAVRFMLRSAAGAPECRAAVRLPLPRLASRVTPVTGERR